MGSPLSRLVAALALLCGGCGGEPAPARNVVLIVADTLRADHLGAYGYTRDVSPRLDAFAARATRYANAIASSPWTLPSHASLFTGRDPWQHGAHLVPVRSATPQNVRSLDERFYTLAEALRDEGLRTGGFVANSAFLAPRLGLAQGFDIWEVARERADAKLPAILAWLEASREQPFFLFVNFMDTHRPYNTAPRPGLIDPPAARGEDLLGELIRTVLPRGEPPPAALVQRVIDQYDTAIAHVDEAIGALLDELERLDLYDETLVVVTSDHGEFFGEHGLVEHSKDVYQEVLAVPLLVKPAGRREARTVDTLVSSAHVPHLVVRELPAGIAGRLATHFPRAPGPLVLAESHYGHAKDARHRLWGRRFRRARRAVFDPPFKFIHSSDGRHELYDLAADPAERHTLAGEHPERVTRYTAHLTSRPAATAVTDDGALEPELEEELRALGYAE